MYYNTAAVIDADGTYLGKYRKNHIPQVAPGFWEKFYFKPGQPRLSGVPDEVREGRRLHLLRPPLSRGRARARPQRRGDRVQSVGDRCGTVGISVEARAARARRRERLFRRRDQPSRHEAPWNIGEFYGQSYFCDPRGKMLAEASRDRDELVIAELDLDKIREVRNTWQFFRDRRPETYTGIVAL